MSANKDGLGTVDPLVSELENRLKNLEKSSISINEFYYRTVAKIVENLKSGYYSDLTRSDDQLISDLKSVGYHDLASRVLSGRTV